MTEQENREGIIIQGLDLIDVMRLVDKKKNKFIALTLQEAESTVEEFISKEEFKTCPLRKAILDGINEYTRSLMRALLGDIEVPPYHG